MSLAVVGGYTDIVKLLSRREICVSDIHFKLAAKYGRVHTARLLMQLRWNSDLLRAEAEDYGNNAIVQLATKHELPSKSSFQDKWVRFLNSNLNMIKNIVLISQFNMFFCIWYILTDNNTMNYNSQTLKKPRYFHSTKPPFLPAWPFHVQIGSSHFTIFFYGCYRTKSKTNTTKNGRGSPGRS